MAASTAPRLHHPGGQLTPRRGHVSNGEPGGPHRSPDMLWSHGKSSASNSGPGLMPMPLPSTTEQRTATALPANRHLAHSGSLIPPPPLLNGSYSPPRPGANTKLNMDKLQREMESMQQWLVLDQ